MIEIEMLVVIVLVNDEWRKEAYF